MRRLPQADLDAGNAPGNKKTTVATFRVAAVLSVYHDKLMCSFDEQREVLDFMAGERVYLWDIPVAIKLCRKSLTRQYPWLKNRVPDPNAKPDTYPKFVRETVKSYGSDTIEVAPLKLGVFQARSCSETL